MGGKSSSGSSTTTPTIPPWLQGIIQPLLSGSAQKMQTLQNQGWDVLQGNQPETGVSLEEVQRGGVGGGGGAFPGGPEQKYPEGVGGGVPRV